MSASWAPSLVELIRRVDEKFPVVEPPPKNPLEGIKRVVLYTRQSKEDKKRGSRSLSPRVQRRAMEVLARAQRWEVVRVFEDVGISGKGFAERPGWDALMKFISKTQPAIDAVLVARVDRYARNVAEGLHVLDNELGPLHVRLRAADAPYIEPESLYGRITFTFALLMGEHERLLLVERTKAALAERRREGVHLGEFPKFFGRDDQGRLVPGETALAIVRGRTEGRTYADIARELGISRRQAWATAKFIAKKRAEWEDLNEEDT